MKAISKNSTALVNVGKLIAALVIFANVTFAAHKWEIDLVDQSGIAKFSSMKIDNLGNVHVAYIVEDAHILMYAFWDHALKRWFTMRVSQSASFSSLTLDSKGRPHISWADQGTSIGCG